MTPQICLPSGSWEMNGIHVWPTHAITILLVSKHDVTDLSSLIISRHEGFHLCCKGLKVHSRDNTTSIKAVLVIMNDDLWLAGVRVVCDELLLLVVESGGVDIPIHLQQCCYMLHCCFFPPVIIIQLLHIIFQLLQLAQQGREKEQVQTSLCLSSSSISSTFLPISSFWLSCSATFPLFSQ